MKINFYRGIRSGVRVRVEDDSTTDSPLRLDSPRLPTRPFMSNSFRDKYRNVISDVASPFKIQNGAISFSVFLPFLD